MDQFIDSFGYTNFIILMIIVAVIVIALIILFIIDRSQKKNISKEIAKFKNENIVKKEEKEEKRNDEVVYIEKKDDVLEAKKALADTFTRLKEEEKKEEDIITNTEFEKDQEENSIISYDELKEASKNIDMENQALLDDEGNEPITIDELYEIHEENQYESPKDLSNPIFTDTYDDINKFKKSEVISPVFGIYRKNYDNYSVDKYYNTMDLKDIEQEIRKTEEFLEELKKIRNNLK